MGKIIHAGNLNEVYGVKPSEVEPLDVLIALTKRISKAEHEISLLRTRVYNLEIELAMHLESKDVNEKKDKL